MRNTSNTRRRGDSGDTPFGEWLRFHPELDSRVYGLDIENIDYTLFLYARGYLRLLEEKMKYTNFSSLPQRDTHSVLDQICQFACSHPDFTAKRVIAGRIEKITYGGYHLVQFEKTNPDDGGVHLNGMPVTREQFLLFIQGKWEPFVQYKHMQKHQVLLLDILECQTQEDLTEIKDRIVSDILPTIEQDGPEHELLRKVFAEQSDKVRSNLLSRINQDIQDVEGGMHE
jgi:hypothetical protein